MIIITNKTGELKKAFAETDEAYLAYGSVPGESYVSVYAYGKVFWTPFVQTALSPLSSV